MRFMRNVASADIVRQLIWNGPSEYFHSCRRLPFLLRVSAVRRPLLSGRRRELRGATYVVGASSSDFFRTIFSLGTDSLILHFGAGGAGSQEKLVPVIRHELDPLVVPADRNRILRVEVHEINIVGRMSCN